MVSRTSRTGVFRVATAALAVTVACCALAAAPALASEDKSAKCPRLKERLGQLNSEDVDSQSLAAKELFMQFMLDQACLKRAAAGGLLGPGLLSLLQRDDSDSVSDSDGPGINIELGKGRAAAVMLLVLEAVPQIAKEAPAADLAAIVDTMVRLTHDRHVATRRHVDASSNLNDCQEAALEATGTEVTVTADGMVHKAQPAAEGHSGSNWNDDRHGRRVLATRVTAVRVLHTLFKTVPASAELASGVGVRGALISLLNNSDVDEWGKAKATAALHQLFVAFPASVKDVSTGRHDDAVDVLLALLADGNSLGKAKDNAAESLRQVFHVHIQEVVVVPQHKTPMSFAFQVDRKVLDELLELLKPGSHDGQPAVAASAALKQLFTVAQLPMAALNGFGQAAVDELLRLLRNGNDTEKHSATHVLSQLFGEVPECTRYALGNDEQMINGLLHLLKQGNHDGRIAAARALYTLFGHVPPTAELALDGGAMDGLISLLHDLVKDCLSQCSQQRELDMAKVAESLEQLLNASTTAIVGPVRSDGVLNALLHLLKDGSTVGKVKAASGLGTLFAQAPPITSVAYGGVLDGLIALLQDSDTSGHAAASSALEKLFNAVPASAQEASKHGALDLLRRRATDQNAAAKGEALAALLQMIEAYPPSGELLSDTVALEKLISSLLQKDDIDGKREAARQLRKRFVAVPAKVQHAFDLGLMGRNGLDLLIRSGDTQARLYAADIFQLLFARVPGSVHAATGNGGRVLVRDLFTLSLSDRQEERKAAAAALNKLLVAAAASVARAHDCESATLRRELVQSMLSSEAASFPRDVVEAALNATRAATSETLPLAADETPLAALALAHYLDSTASRCSASRESTILLELCRSGFSFPPRFSAALSFRKLQSLRYDEDASGKLNELACRDDYNFSDVQCLIVANVDTADRGDHDKTAMMCAVERYDVKLMEELLLHNAAVEGALGTAILDPNATVIRLLLNDSRVLREETPGTRFVAHAVLAIFSLSEVSVLALIITVLAVTACFASCIGIASVTTWLTDHPLFVGAALCLLTVVPWLVYYNHGVDKDTVHWSFWALVRTALDACAQWLP